MNALTQISNVHICQDRPLASVWQSKQASFAHLPCATVPFSTQAIGTFFPNTKAVTMKANNLQKAGELIRLKRGLYVISPKESGETLSTELIANHIYGPSYVSLQTALRFYGLIPEAVHEIQSMTIKRARLFTNDLGVFNYISCPRDYFSIGIRQITINNNTLLIATPEKALCDTLCYTPNLNIRYKKELSILLEDNWRFDMDVLQQMNTDIIEQCAAVGKKQTTLLQLLKLIRHE